MLLSGVGPHELAWMAKSAPDTQSDFLGGSFVATTAHRNSDVVCATVVLYHAFGVTSQEFKRWLAKQGCTFESGHGGHLIVRLGARMSVLPMHGKQKELGIGLVNRIKKDLSLK